MKTDLSSQRGFSLIELLIVVAIIGIIAAIVIPYLEQSRQAARKASAIQSIRMIHSSEASYKAAYGQFGDLAALGAANYLNDPDLRAGRKSQYDFAVTMDALNPALNYEATATPVITPTTSPHFYVNATGIMRSELGAAATSSSAPLD